MPRPEQIALEVPASGGGIGKAELVERFRDKTVQFATVNGRLQIQGSIDGTNFEQVGSDINQDTFRLVDEAIKFLRIRRSSGSSSGDSATFAGFDFRTF